MRDRRYLSDRIEGPSIDVAGLRDHDRRLFATLDGRFESVDLHPAHAVGRYPDDAVVAQAQELQRGKDRGMGFLADDDAERRGTEQPIGFHVPADATQQFSARGGEAGQVGHGRARDESDRRFSWQVEQVEQPIRRRLFAGRGRRRHGMAAAILAPRAGEPVGGDPDGMRGTHDPAEKSRPGHGREPRPSHGRQFLDHGETLFSLFRQRGGEGLAHLGEAPRRPLRTLAEGAAKAECDLRRVPQHQLVVGMPGAGRLRRPGLSSSRHVIHRPFLRACSEP